MHEPQVPDEECQRVLAAVLARPGALAADMGRRWDVVPSLRRLREAGLVRREGESPSRWYPTPAGIRVQALARIRAAEALHEFADTLTAPRLPVLCPPSSSPRSLSFGELAVLLEQNIGREVMVSTDPPETTWPPVSPITAVGEINFIEQERERDVGDWRLNLSLDDCAFVEFSRRRFERATQGATIDELHVTQAGQTTVLNFAIC